MEPMLLVFVAAVVLAAMSGAVFKPGAWYAGLRKPSWTPRDWMFPVVWTVLYTMMAVAAWLVWKTAGDAAWWPALTLWFVQLGFNAGWSAVFFGLKRMDLALLEVVGLWLAVAATIAAFWAIRADAGALLIPYLVWVTIAAALNFRVMRMNAAAPATAQA